ncbi:MAG: hypothetical protein WDW36_006204 [Sanguina aurantia]
MTNLVDGLMLILWCITTTSMVFYNRYMLLTLHFNFPISLTLWHMIISSGLACLLVKSGWVSSMPLVSWLSMMRRIIPIAAANALGLLFSNQALSLASIAFIQIIKAGSAVCTYTTGLVLGTETLSTILVLDVLLISVGIGMSAAGEALFAWAGFLCVVMGMVAEGCRLNLVQLLMQSTTLPYSSGNSNSSIPTSSIDTSSSTGVKKSHSGVNLPPLTSSKGSYNLVPLVSKSSGSSSDLESSVPTAAESAEAGNKPGFHGPDWVCSGRRSGKSIRAILPLPAVPEVPPSLSPLPPFQLNPISTLYYIAPVSALFLLVPWLILESRLATAFLLSPACPPLWHFATNGVNAFALNLMVFLVINRTSALTMNIAGLTKDVLTVVLSVALLGTHLTGLQVCGYVTIIGGVGMYNRVRTWQRNQPKPTTSSQSEHAGAKVDSEIQH